MVAAPTKNKLRLAKELGADEVVHVDRDNPEGHRKPIQGRFPKGFDVVIDATGVATVTEKALQYAKFGAKIVIYGVCDEEDRIQVSPYEIFRRELKLIGSFAQTHCFDRALTYLENRTVRVDRLVTHAFSLEDYGRAIEVIRTNREAIKVVIKP